MQKKEFEVQLAGAGKRKGKWNTMYTTECRDTAMHWFKQFSTSELSSKKTCRILCTTVQVTEDIHAIHFGEDEAAEAAQDKGDKQ
tara:strand:- start:298 stop:552 length:255 start_codon:yes stop_codon:yes gene_type:complete